MRKKLVKYGLIHALGEAAYITLVASFMENASKYFGSEPGIFGGAAFLMLFVISAAVSGALILGKPIMLYSEGKKREAIALFVITLGWMLALLFILLIVLANLR